MNGRMALFVKTTRLDCLMFAALFLFSSCTSAQGTLSQALAKQAACDHLRVVVSLKQHAVHGANEYHCDSGGENFAKGYYVLALRSNYPAPKDAGSNWAGSSLVGWYAVRASDGQVRKWNVAEFKPGAVVP